VTRPVRFEAQVFAYGPAKDDPQRFEAGFDLTGQIDRTDFGSNGGLPEVSALLPVHIRLLMTSR
jgi:polyisoprenoid-binding protein YceI